MYFYTKMEINNNNISEMYKESKRGRLLKVISLLYLCFTIVISVSVFDSLVEVPLLNLLNPYLPWVELFVEHIGFLCERKESPDYVSGCTYKDKRLKDELLMLAYGVINEGMCESSDLSDLRGRLDEFEAEINNLETDCGEANNYKWKMKGRENIISGINKDCDYMRSCIGLLDKAVKYMFLHKSGISDKAPIFRKVVHNINNLLSRTNYNHYDLIGVGESNLEDKIEFLKNGWIVKHERFNAGHENKEEIISEIVSAVSIFEPDVANELKSYLDKLTE